MNWLNNLVRPIISISLFVPAPARQITLNAPSATEPSMIEVGALSVPEGSFVATVIDPTSGFAYFGTRYSPGEVVKVRLRTSLS